MKLYINLINRRVESISWNLWTAFLDGLEPRLTNELKRMNACCELGCEIRSS